MTRRNPRWFPDHDPVGPKDSSFKEPAIAPIGTRWVGGVRVEFDKFPVSIYRRPVVGLSSNDGKVYLYDGSVIEETDPNYILNPFSDPVRCSHELGSRALANYNKHNNNR